MNLRIIYPRRMPFFVVKHRTNTYFRQTEYAERNNVYTHKYATNTYILQKNAIDIIAEANDTKSLRAILDYLTHVFGMNEIGLSISSPKYYSYFNELNYIKINRHSPYLSITLHKCYPYYLFGISTFPNSAYHTTARRKFSITIV